MVDRLHFTDSDEANELIAHEPFALLIGFVLDQQVTVQKAFEGPLVLRERAGTLDAAQLAAMDLEPLFRQRPAIHRFPGAMAQRVRALAAHVAAVYGRDAARIWSGASSPDELRANLEALPGFGEMKVKALAAVLAKRFGVAAAQGLLPAHPTVGGGHSPHGRGGGAGPRPPVRAPPTLGDVDSPQALADYQAGKRAHKAAMRPQRAAAPRPG